MKWLLAFFLLCSISSCGVCILIDITEFTIPYKQNCGDYLRLAANAPTVERAEGFLSKAVAYLEANNKTSGNSAFIIQTPENDLGIWYGQLSGALATLREIIQRPNATQLEKDNALMKLREVLVDTGTDGDKIVQPTNVVFYPYHWIMTIWYALSIICTLCLLAVWYIILNG